MQRRISLRLVHAATEEAIEDIDVILDPDHPDSYPALRRHFIAMASRAAGENPEYDIERMPYLHEFTLLVCEGGNYNDVLMRYREG